VSAYRFGRIEVRSIERQLLINGQPAVLGARAFDLLLALVEHRDRVVSKNELLELVWPGLVVEENNLQVQISTLRKLLGPHTIATIPGRGYHFTAVLHTGVDSESALLATPALSAATAVSEALGNVPSHVPSLIGRDEELRSLLSQIETHRLVTIIGAAGMGKTVLAVAAAHAMRDRWRDGTWLVELAPVTEPAQVAHAVAEALRISLGAAGPAQDLVVGVLQSRSLLLVLDNCEHVLDAAAALAAAIVAHAPDVHVLATSQELLNVTGEKVVKLGPLGLPDASEAPGDGAGFGALRLFAERAQAVDPGFELRAANATAVADICRHLDGLPLAIELAAARVRVLGVQGVRERLDERFRVLTGGARTALRRHQNLHAALDWSHALLSPDEQVVLRRLGVFVGGFTLELAQDVAGDTRLDEWAVPDALSALVDKSMVVAQSGDAPRYALLETTRAYALEKLAQAGETDALVRRHAEAVRALFERADEERFGEQGTLSEDAYVERLQPELDNLRAALAWATGSGGDETHAIALAASSARVVEAVGLAAEGLARLCALMPRVGPGVDTAVATRFWWAISMVARDWRIDDGLYVQALERAGHGCRALGWQRRHYSVLLQKAWRLFRQQEIADGEAVLAEAIGMEQPRWPGWLRSGRFNTQSLVAQQTGAPLEVALACYEAIDALLPPEGEALRRHRLTANMGVALMFHHQWQQAASLLEPLVAGARLRRRHPVMPSWTYGNLLEALVPLGRLGEARKWLREALPLWRADAIVHAFLHAAIRLLAAEGRIADAMRLVGAEDVSPRQFAPRSR
jgi:predicted ATPase/DNA-binding winged helix-turn-helix (wHTH) protein